MQNRLVRLILSGPWSDDGSLIHVDCQLEFPEGYPAASMPLLSIEKSVSIDHVVIAKLMADVRSIGQAYMVYHRACLEALIRYLQGDQSVEQLLTWTKDALDDSVMDLSEAIVSSSDEEDDLGPYQITPGEFALHGSGILNGLTNANAPLPKTCGAVWAANGMLICFFPPKEDPVSSLADTFGLGQSLASRSKKEGFEVFWQSGLQSSSYLSKQEGPF